MRTATVIQLGVAAVVLGAAAFLALRPPPRPGADHVSPTPSAAPSAPSPGSALALESLLGGQLRVRVHDHAIHSIDGPVPAWTYVSEGLRAVGQREVVFAVARDPGEPVAAYPRELLHFYEGLYDFAKKKVFVEEGGFTELGPDGPGILRSDLRGVLYTAAAKIEGVELPSGALQALVLTAGEIAVARDYGAVRVMALLGRKYRYFPAAPWLDRKRPELATPAEMRASGLGRMPRLPLLTGSARQEGGVSLLRALPADGGTPDHEVTAPNARVVLLLKPAAREALKEMAAKIPTGDPRALLLALDPEADACLSWIPGQDGPFAIALPGASGARIAGDFVAFAPGANDDGALRVEDGFRVILRTETWKKLLDALVEGRPFTVPSTREYMTFEVRWSA